MCGLSGFISSGSLTDSATQMLRSIAATISHSGPDDSGTWHDTQTDVGLAHTGLSIVDLSPAGHQPMRSACDCYVIAFNGEIYNHLKLRDQLQAEEKAPACRGHSNTETLLAFLWPGA
jgi:asparagine synthase (glutamine-hydrolysing)